jgi:hypothetical protein
MFSKDLPWLMYGFGDADKPIKMGNISSAASDMARIFIYSFKILLLYLCPSVTKYWMCVSAVPVAGFCCAALSQTLLGRDKILMLCFARRRPWIW